MKKVVLSLLLCFMASAIYSQTIDVIHLKNGLDARGTIIDRTESQITVQIENGRTLSFDMSEIDSMEQEQKAFDPRVLIGRWACYKANGERDKKCDIEIKENAGFYTVNYDKMLIYMNKSTTLNSVSPATVGDSRDIDVKDGTVAFTFYRIERNFVNCGSRNEYESMIIHYHRIFNLEYEDGKLKGFVECVDYWVATGNTYYSTALLSRKNGSRVL